VVTVPRSAADVVRHDADTPAGDASVPVVALVRRPWRTVLLVALVVLLAAPLLIALVKLHHPRWYPVLDLAWTEMRLRDVWTSHTPLVGLAGRIGSPTAQGSHPGPLSFYALWPVYELLGARSWAMEASTVALHVAAVAIIIWIAYRRAGLLLVLGFAAVLAVVLRGLGASALTQPWNPYLPVLWWLVFLLAIWSVFSDDLALLPLAALAGSFCAQTEVAYLGITVGLGTIAVGVAGVRAFRERADRTRVRHFVVLTGAAVAVSVLVWLPPLVQQVTTQSGNLSLLFNYLTHPPQPPVGLHQGLNTMLAHLDPLHPIETSLLPATQPIGTGSTAPGAVFLAVWAASALLAWRLHARAIVRLNAVLACAVVLGTLSISRIFGLLWKYLTLWGWGVGALMVVAVGWTLGVVVVRRLPDDARRRMQVAAMWGFAAVIVAFTTLFGFEATSVHSPTPALGDQLGDIVGPTAGALDRLSRTTVGQHDRYLVTYSDPDNLGSQAFGLVNELERDGFNVGAPAALRTIVGAHRVLATGEATAVVHLSVGPDIATWRGLPGARQIAFSDRRSRPDRAEYARLRSEVVAGLRAHGLVSEVPQVDQLVGFSPDPSLPQPIRARLSAMSALRAPVAVFLAPPNVQP
jgi:hypothetical protein